MRSLSWRSILYAVTFVLFALAIVFWVLTFTGWLITDPGFEPLNVLAAALVSSLGGLLALLKARTAKDTPVLTYSPTPEQRERNRRVMLDLVRNFWVKGVLEPSLHGAAMIELGLERRRDAVERPWNTVLQRPGQASCPITRGTRIISVFNAMNKELLILGAPGSGKTTMLLELARDAIARAEQDPTQPIPAVFNLSSWADERQPIADWLVNELNTKYNIPEKIARPWVECDELLLLLDGLDEVALKWQEDCVKAINEFRQEHWVPLVVCSRVADCEVLTARLKLQGAVLLQSLTAEQVNEYLEGADIELVEVREALQHDPTLQELAETPLMLRIITLAYQGISLEDLPAPDTMEAYRKHLFDTYVQRMFERRGADHPYPQPQTIHWLAWLAQNMSEHTQSMFLIEGLQPSWLSTHTQRRSYHVIASLVIGSIFGLVWASGVGALVGVISEPYIGLVVGAIAWPIMAFIGMRTGSKMLDLPTGEMHFEELKFSWIDKGIEPTWVFIALIVVELISGFGCGGLVHVTGGRWLPASILGLIGGLVTWLNYALIFGMTFSRIDTTSHPNQGIRQSVKNGVLGGLSLGSIAGLSFGTVFGMARGLGSGLLAGLLYWAIAGLFVGLIFGGLDFIRHFTLRLLLWRSGYLPWNLVRFLNYAAERIFLRKVGGGYIFIHPLLQDHFASLYQDQ